MKASSVISDSSCLIALRDLGQLDLLRRLFGRVVIPPAVSRESGLPPPDWLFVEAPADAGTVAALQERLDPGESEAIALALEKGWPVILDEKAGRKEAARRGLAVQGTGALLLYAKRRGEIAAVRPMLDALEDGGFRLGGRLRLRLLELAGEADPEA